MKKIGLLGVFVLCLLLSGCGEKKLICSYSSSNSFYGSDDIIARFTFKKDGTIKDYSINEKMEYSDAYLSQTGTKVDDQYKNAQQYCKNSIPENKNIECNVTKSGNSVRVVIDYKLSKMTEDDIASLNLAEYLTSKYDDIKKQYSEQGFTCK